MGPRWLKPFQAQQMLEVTQGAWDFLVDSLVSRDNFRENASMPSVCPVGESCGVEQGQKILLASIPLGIMLPPHLWCGLWSSRNTFLLHLRHYCWWLLVYMDSQQISISSSAEWGEGVEPAGMVWLRKKISFWPCVLSIIGAWIPLALRVVAGMNPGKLASTHSEPVHSFAL